jgi:heme-degrading monooxygenase HmoA
LRNSDDLSSKAGQNALMLANTPSPPYTAVIFTAVRTTEDDAGYEAMAEDMVRLAAQQPGYLGVESARDPATRLGITVSYWRDATDAAAWKQVAEHLVAQELGRTRWYECYETRIATVERAYGV